MKCKRLSYFCHFFVCVYNSGLFILVCFFLNKENIIKLLLEFFSFFLFIKHTLLNVKKEQLFELESRDVVLDSDRVKLDRSTLFRNSGSNFFNCSRLCNADLGSFVRKKL